MMFGHFSAATCVMRAWYAGMSQLWLSTRFQPFGIPPGPAWLTMAHIRPCFLIVSKSVGPISSTECNPMRFAFAARSSSGMSLKHQRHTDCLIVLDFADARVTCPSLVARSTVPLVAHAVEVPTAPKPASAPPTTALRCMNSRRVGIRTSLLRHVGENYQSSMPFGNQLCARTRIKNRGSNRMMRMERMERIHEQLQLLPRQLHL